MRNSIYGQDLPGLIDPAGSRYVPSGVPAELSKNGGGGTVFSDNPRAGGITLFDNVIPAPERFDELLNPIGAADIIWHEFYDSAALSTGAATDTSLFLAAQASIFNGNLRGANGTLQGKEKFLVCGIRFELEADVAASPLDAADVKEIFRLGTYELWVDNKQYNYGKLMRFLNPEAPILVNTNYYQQNPFMTYKLPIQVPIGTRVGFRVDVSLTSPTISGNWRIFCYLVGALYRGVQ